MLDGTHVHNSCRWTIPRYLPECIHLNKSHNSSVRSWFVHHHYTVFWVLLMILDKNPNHPFHLLFPSIYHLFRPSFIKAHSNRVKIKPNGSTRLAHRPAGPQNSLSSPCRLFLSLTYHNTIISIKTVLKFVPSVLT